MPPDNPAVPCPGSRISRRRLLGIPVLAAAAVPLGAAPAVAGPSPGAGPRSGAGLAADQADQAYQQLFRTAVAADPAVRLHTVPGREFSYRPRQLLVAPADKARVVARLRTYGHNVTENAGFAGVARLLVESTADIPSLVTRLRDQQQWQGQPVPRVQPHHVAVGFGNIMGNPGGPPRATGALPAPDPARLGEGAGVTVGVCDTGIWRLAGSRHPQWLGGRYLPETDDEDLLYSHLDVLAPQGGHGTFVAGVIRQAAPGVRFDPEAALNATGVGDEEMLVGALGRLDPATSVVNLSLGYYTQDDLAPLPLANALAALPSRTAVVAAAGNAGTARRSWPAAFDRVVAVSAVDVTGTGYLPAPYSGFGPWVDACAVGEHTSTYVDGRLQMPGQPTRWFHGFAAWAGTSFAAAHVSGRLTALMTATGLDAEAARALLLSGPRWHPDYGVLVG
ncbi:S8/S53 family peptidase [Polymorphospora sp. NPDC050346]|uniref:S8 family peptidase n=1 Tax=Polymorphospora sp. NPDC050346 TaxID=3155780 RepID=UPI00340336C9